MTTTPVPQHTDQCIRDAAQFGFCDHTRLYATRRPPPRPLPRYLRPPPSWTSRPLPRELTAWAGVLLIFAPSIWLLLTHGWLAFLACYATGLGWLLVFTCGLPRGLTADLSRALPPDAKDRLNNPSPEER